MLNEQIFDEYEDAAREYHKLLIPVRQKLSQNTNPTEEQLLALDEAKTRRDKAERAMHERIRQHSQHS